MKMKMKIQKRHQVLAVSLLLVLIVLGAAAAIFLKPGGAIDLSSARIPGEALGRSWSGPSGLALNDFQALAGMSEDEKQAIAVLRSQLEPAGVSGIADFTYRQKGNLLSQAAVKIYVFKTPELCQKWVNENYQGPGWDSTYRKVRKPGCVCFETLVGRKQIAATGRILVMASSQGNSDIHLRLLDLYLRRLW
jgi:hypothetical protein